MNRTAFRFTILLACLAYVGCSKTSTTAGDETAQPRGPADPTAGGGSGATAPPSSPITLTSTAFAEGGVVPSRFTCEGADVSPPLAWNDVPANTKSIALVVDDPDAPDPNSPKRKTFTHWIVYNLPPTMHGLPEGTKTAPPGARDGQNDFGGIGYRGPCPPSGSHRYVFKVYALDTTLSDLNKPRVADIDRAMDGHVIGHGRLVGTYEKGHPRI